MEDTPKVGRPTTYTQELADKICQELALGYSMRTVCSADDMPAMSTVFKWLREKEGFSEQYEKAKQESTDAMAEDVLDIADDGTNDWINKENDDGESYTVLNSENIQRSRLRIDTRKWLMSKMKPKKYGEKLDMTSLGEKITGVVILPAKIENPLATTTETSDSPSQV